MKKKFYYNVLSTKFILYLKLPTSDTRKLCDCILIKLLTENNENIKQSVETKQELHFRKPKQAREKMKTHKIKASHKTNCFDLKKALPFPELPTFVAYYKRSL